MVIYYKGLDEQGCCRSGDVVIKWSLPQRDNNGNWIPGDWMPPVRDDDYLAMITNDDELICYDDIILEHNLIDNLAPRIFVVEMGNEVVNYEMEYYDEGCDDRDYIVRRRLISEVESWNESLARNFACDCAEKVLPIYEKIYPGDDRPRKAIAAARRFAQQEGSYEEMKEAFAMTDAACHESDNRAAQHVARAAALTSATDRHIAYCASDAVKEARSAVYRFTFTSIDEMTNMLGIKERKTWHDVMKLVDVAWDYMFIWQADRLRQYIR